MLSGLENNTPLVFGNEKFDGEMTEIRIWNQRLPIEFIKENYKTPLPILAENKKKLKMNINTNVTKKDKGSNFLFGDKDTFIKTSTFKETKTRKFNINSIENNNMNNNGFYFNNNEQFNNNGFGDAEYPSLDVLNSQSAGNPNNNFGNNLSLSNNPSSNNFGNPNNNNQFMQSENDFNFDK